MCVIVDLCAGVVILVVVAVVIIIITKKLSQLLYIKSNSNLPTNEWRERETKKAYFIEILLLLLFTGKKQK